MFTLRPHHLLCIQKYTGHGYDEAFTRRMDRVIRDLKADPDTIVELKVSGDLLCEACPHYDGSACRSAEKVRAIDGRVLRLCGVCHGKKECWRILADRTARVFETDCLEKICGDCQWIALCKNTKKGNYYDCDE